MKHTSGLSARGRERVQHRREDLLAHAGLAEHEHRDGARREALDHRAQALERAAVGDDAALSPARRAPGAKRSRGAREQRLGGPSVARIAGDAHVGRGSLGRELRHDAARELVGVVASRRVRREELVLVARVAHRRRADRPAGALTTAGSAVAPSDDARSEGA